MRIITCCIILILITASCEKDSKDNFKNTITISSRKYFTTLYFVKGYSFEEHKFVEVILMTENADIAPVDSIDLQGDAVGIYLSVLSNNSYGFYLNARHNNLTDATTFFNNYNTAEFPSFTQLTYALKPYDIYTLKTSRNNFVKFMVKDVRKVSDYYEADLKYVIQKDGTNLFPE